MSADRDVTRIVRSWLEEGVTALPDRVLDDVLDQLPATHQRRAWWPAWRFRDMNTSIKLAIAAAAVVVVAIIGYNLLPGPNNVGGPSPTPTTGPSPSATPAAFVYPTAGPLAIGSHSLTVQGVPLSFSLATSGWSVDTNGFIVKGTGVAVDEAAFLFWSPVNIYPDPCTRAPLNPPAGPSAADLATAISTAHGTDATEPSDVAVDGRAAKYVVLTVPEKSDCVSNFYLWYNDCAGDPSSNAATCYRFATRLGDTLRIWIVDVDGARLSIEANTRKVAGPEVEQEIQQIVDSIRFE